MTPDHHRLLRYVARYRLAYGRGPTQREIAAHLGCTRQRVQGLVATMRNRGLVRSRWRGQRSVEIVGGETMVQ